MKQSVSHYVMPDEKEEATAELVHRLGLDGIENLIYGDEPSSNLFHIAHGGGASALLAEVDGFLPGKYEAL